MGNALKARRKQLSMTQKDVAKQLGVKHQTYSHYENGKRQPRIEVMRKIAQLFNSSMDELFF